jgi:hypothetical protein
MVSSSSNDWSVELFMLLVPCPMMRKTVDAETLLYLSANSETVSVFFQEVGLLSSRFHCEYEINTSVVRLHEPSSKVHTSRVLLLFISSTQTSPIKVSRVEKDISHLRKYTT